MSMSLKLLNIINDIKWDFVLAVGDLNEVVDNIGGNKQQLKELIEELSQGDRIEQVAVYAKQPLKLHAFIFKNDIFAGTPREQIIKNTVHPSKIVESLQELSDTVDSILEESTNEEFIELQLSLYFKAFMAIHPCTHPFMLVSIIIAALGRYVLGEYYIITIP